jgi:hypothetical protein
MAPELVRERGYDEQPAPVLVIVGPVGTFPSVAIWKEARQQSQPSGGGLASSAARRARSPAALPALTEYRGASGPRSTRNRPRRRAYHRPGGS